MVRRIKVFKASVYLLTIVFIATTLLPKLETQAEALQSYSVWGDNISNQETSINNLPDNPIFILTGELLINESDINIPAFGYSIDLIRQYRTTNKDKLTPFGYGWDFSYSNYIQLFADFNIAEIKPFGAQTNYYYTKNDPLGLVDSYDNDSLIYYPLEQGYYTSTSLSLLERISMTDYRVTSSDGLVYIYYGYYAPWRKNADPKAGKLVSIMDKYGNQFNLNYDNQGNLIKIIAANNNYITLTYNNNLVTKVSDNLGKEINYQYDEINNLINVTYPDNTYTIYTYDSEHRLIGITTPKTGEKTFTYNGERVKEYKHEQEIIYTYSYNDLKKEITITDKNNKNYVFNYHGELLYKKLDTPNSFSFFLIGGLFLLGLILLIFFGKKGTNNITS